MEPQEQPTATTPKAGEIEAFVDQMSAMLGLPIPVECRPGVIGNMTRTAAIAKLVLEFPLPVDVEAGPIFKP